MIKHVKYSNLINKHDMPTKYYSNVYIYHLYCFIISMLVLTHQDLKMVHSLPKYILSICIQLKAPFNKCY